MKETKYYRCWAEIDLKALDSNIDAIRAKVGERVDILAVIKANAYGHGAVEFAHRLEEKVQYFAVATLEEALELREHGIKLPIMLLGYISPSQYEEAMANDIIVTITNYEEAKSLSNQALALQPGKPAKFHIALDTGMTRIGFVMNSESVAEVVKISQLPGIEMEGMFSHFSCADMSNKAYTNMQKESYDWFVGRLAAEGVEIPRKHLCNSAGIIEFDDHRFKMVRAGIILYGLYPSKEVRHDEVKLTPVMSWKSHVVDVKLVQPGHGVSYGATYITQAPTMIATLSVGYADGYPRSLSNLGRVLIHGQYAKIIGRICMDQMMVDVTDIPDVKVEDEVVLVGKQGENELTMEEVSELAGSFNYELPCVITNRVTRVYKE